MKHIIMTTLATLLGLVLTAAIAGMIFLNSERFGKEPAGKRKERIMNSPNFRDGAFRNLQATVMMTTNKGFVANMWSFLFGKNPENLRPATPAAIVKEDYLNMPDTANSIVWFGHSSYLFTIGGIRFLVDPVFYDAAPVGFVNKPFEGTNVFAPADLPDIDYLIITHDHWDHLDHRLVKEMAPRIGKVVCPLGVGAHFEHWGYPAGKLIEMDWWEESQVREGLRISCLPARHFSGRGLKRNLTLWASFMIGTAEGNIFIGGDGGYGSHFAEIHKKYPDIALAILENGQYNRRWSKIHCMPHQLGKVDQDLQPRHIITVHHGKYALAAHPWDEPLDNERKYLGNRRLSILQIGKITPLPLK